MKNPSFYLCFLAVAVFSPILAAQDKPRTDAKANGDSVTTPIKVQIVFTEFDGDKKVKSLPYTIYHNTTHGQELRPDFTKLRIGSRIPVTTGGGQMQYLDVGTNLDCRAVRNDDGHFMVQLSVERSWVEGEVAVAMNPAAADRPEGGATFKEPIIRNVRSDLYLNLRDGQTVEGVMATDPLNARVVRVEVTLNVVK
jgi:hypothetical protein